MVTDDCKDSLILRIIGILALLTIPISSYAESILFAGTSDLDSTLRYDINVDFSEFGDHGGKYGPGDRYYQWKVMSPEIRAKINKIEKSHHEKFSRVDSAFCEELTLYCRTKKEGEYVVEFEKEEVMGLYDERGIDFLTGATFSEIK